MTTLFLSDDDGDDDDNEKVRHTSQTIKCSKKWKPQEVVKQAETF